MGRTFDAKSQQRIADAVRWVEGRRTALEERPEDLGDFFYFETTETANSGTVAADIKTFDDDEVLVEGGEVKYRDGVLDGEDTGFSGVCIQWGENYWHLDASGSRLRFAVLLEDAASKGELWAKETDEVGVDVTPENIFQVTNWGQSGLGVLANCLVGFFGLYEQKGGKWVFKQSDICAPEGCEHSGTVSGLSLSATEGTAITPAHDITASGIEVGTFSVGALPTGLTYTPGPIPENGGTITGTPAAGTAGTHIVQITAESVKTGPGGSPTGNCTLTRALVITIAEA